MNETKMISEDFRLASYAFDLPAGQVAQEPAARRDGSRLMVVDRSVSANGAGAVREARFADLPDLLPPGALLVANNSRVLPARLFGRRPTGGRVEFLLLTPLPLIAPRAADGEGAVPNAGPIVGPQAAAPGAAANGAPVFEAEVEGLLRASKPVRPGQQVFFGPDAADEADTRAAQDSPAPSNSSARTDAPAAPEPSASTACPAACPALCTGASDFSLTVLSVGEFGRCTVRLRWRGDLAAQFLELGHLPLPPYIRRPDTPADRERYQTVYADAARTGSVAAPTAGLHFTPEIRAALAARGFQWAEVTLYVGYGTFSPVRCADIREHAMHREYLEVPEATAAAVRVAAAEGRPIVAVGTTSVRALEGAAQATDTRAANLAPFLGWTDIYLYPGREFRVTGHMLTNFHLPESSLVIMVSAFAGRERILSAYSQAIASGFRFFSYGDSMLLL